MAKNTIQQPAPPGLRWRTRPCIWGGWAGGGVLLVWALFLPMATLWQIALCLVLAAAVWFLVYKFGPATTMLEEDITGNTLLDQALKEGRTLLIQLKQADQAIPDPKVSQCIQEIVDLTQQILAAVEQHPGTVGQIRRFLNYYLPTLLELLRKYAELDDISAGQGNVQQSRSKIEEVLQSSRQAFQRLLDSLYASQALDIAAEIEVMDQLMKEEGLGSASSPEQPRLEL